MQRPSVAASAPITFQSHFVRWIARVTNFVGYPRGDFFGFASRQLGADIRGCLAGRGQLFRAALFGFRFRGLCKGHFLEYRDA